ncbi:MAG: hypothetical protein HS116_19695 [Planctomycetes bacterium]|nr:hypothetical protein [Planctomycetota bacterium]
MSDPADAKLLEEIRLSYLENRRKAEYLSRARAWLTVLLAGVILVFLAALYLKASDMYHPRNFEQPLKAESERLAPLARNALHNYVESVGPELGRIAQEKFDAVQPQLDRAVQEEWNTFARTLTTETDQQLRGLLTRIHNRQLEALTNHFPKLTDPVTQETFRKRNEEGLRRDIDDILVDFETSYVRELRTLEGSIQKFRPNRFERFSQDELNRYFIHLWLNMLDLHLMHPDVDTGKAREEGGPAHG